MFCAFCKNIHPDTFRNGLKFSIINILIKEVSKKRKKLKSFKIKHDVANKYVSGKSRVWTEKFELVTNSTIYFVFVNSLSVG